MEAYICSCCGMNLKVDGDLLRCDYCGASYERDDGEKAAAKLKGVLDEAKLELLANRKRLLWAAAHEKYPSKERVVEAANAVLSIDGSDLLALVYLHSHDRDPAKLNQILASAEAAESQAAEVFRWLLPSLSPRMVGPLHDFVDRHFTNERRIGLITELEKEAAKVSEGIYEPSLPREAFLCYSSADMPKVVKTMDSLERNGFSCFAAFRNLRHGKGAQEDYLSAIQTAMRACDALVFFSSGNSRSMDCDAMRVELPYLIQELPDKPRIEYLLEDYGDVPYMVRKTLKKAFPSQEFCVDEEDLMDRIQAAVEAKGPKKDDEAERLRRELEAERERHQKELEESRRAASQIAETGSPKSEDALRKEVEEKVRQDLLREKMEKETRERILAEERAKKAKREAEEMAKKETEEKARREAEARAHFVPRVDGKYVYFGEYPQSEAKEESLVARLKSLQPEDDVVALDGKRYALAKGRYFLFEPIRWRILERKGNEPLLLSDILLDAHRYNKNYKGAKDGRYANNYERSEIRAWLNKDFIKIAFPSGSERILATDVDNSVATTGSKSNRYVCENTSDRVFLLSYQDYCNSSYGFSDDASRQRSPTDYAVAKGAYKDSKNGNGWYWTRSPYSRGSGIVWGVCSVGSLYTDYRYVGFGGICVRPSLRITVAE